MNAIVIPTDLYGEDIPFVPRHPYATRTKDVVARRAASLPANPERRAKLFALEREIGSWPQFECPVTHYFTDGVYVRSMFIPKGVALVGHIHRHACLNIVQYGEIEIATEHGNRRIVGPVTFESSPGTKRAGYALSDTLWTTIHANHDDEADIGLLEDRLIELPMLEDQS